MISHVPYDWSWLASLRSFIFTKTLKKPKPLPEHLIHYMSKPWIYTSNLAFNDRHIHMHAAAAELHTAACALSEKHGLTPEALLIYTVKASVDASPNREAFHRYCLNLWGQPQG